MNWLAQVRDKLRGTLSTQQARTRAENDHLIGARPRAYLVGALGVILSFSSLILQSYLQATAPQKPAATTNQVVRLAVKGRSVFVRPWEYYFASLGPMVGFGLIIVSGALFERSRPRF
jgi:hypothetical protein